MRLGQASVQIVDQDNTRPVDVTVWVFWCFILGHVALWTLVPALTQPNAPLDTIEMLYWGHEWQWGYYKHPPLAGWIAEAACMLLGRSAWPTYLASQLCVVACFWSAWKLAREFFKPWQAICAVALLESSYYYTYTTPELNNNVVSRAFWALSILLFYRALTDTRHRWWVLTGASLALGLLSKYDTAVLAAVMLGFLVVHPTARSKWRTVGPYLAIAASLACLAFHVHWLFSNEFPTIRYFQNRSAASDTLSNHLINPLRFLVSQLGTIIPIVLFSIPLVANWNLRPPSSEHRFKRDFLWAMVIGPVSLIVVASAVLGFNVRSMWGTALWTFMGVFVLSLVHLREDLDSAKKLLRMCVFASLFFASALAVRNTMLPQLRHKASRIHYPGKEIAAQVEHRWQGYSQEPLQLVAGSWWTAANVAFYAEKRASVYADLDQVKSPWTSDLALRENGGVVLWEIGTRDEQLVSGLKNRFPRAKMAAPIEVNWKTSADLPPLLIGVAVIPPAHESLTQSATRVSRETNEETLK